MSDPTVGDVRRRSRSNLRKLAVWPSIRYESGPPRCLPTVAPKPCRSEVRIDSQTARQTLQMYGPYLAGCSARPLLPWQLVRGVRGGMWDVRRWLSGSPH
jgi:hypothetical protein